MDNADYFFVDYERIILLEEKSLIENELIRMYEEYVVNRNMEIPCVFMSHSSCDKSMVATVALDLKERGISS
ncbi:MAG: hypothetical protein E7173_03480 [Firmicutes bacterium]|nr:hypothetical protein [Bacillota bacterium]